MKKNIACPNKKNYLAKIVRQQSTQLIIHAIQNKENENKPYVHGCL